MHTPYIEFYIDVYLGFQSIKKKYNKFGFFLVLFGIFECVFKF